jgi:NAD+ diphosphatase
MSAPITFAGSTLDRAGHLRVDVAWQLAARADADARVVLIGRAGTGETTGPAGADAVFLGLDGTSPVFARLAAGADEQALLHELRDAAARLDPAQAGLFAYAAALLHWHRTHRFCGSCGEPTEAFEAGHVRRCANGHGAHPRTDPVVIMLVLDSPGDRILLGRQASWPAERYSALAGFVEPGEPLEAAVVREVGEEAGVRVTDVRYVASQPWPFPANLMLGFTAEWTGGEARVVDQELEAVRWFTRDEVTDAARADVGWGPDEGHGAPGSLLLPPRLAIARHLVEGWLAGK